MPACTTPKLPPPTNAFTATPRSILAGLFCQAETRPNADADVDRRPASARYSAEAVHAARSAPDGGDPGGRSRFDDTWIAKCLPRREQEAGANRAGKVYNHSKRMKEKRAVLDGVAAELRRIIGKPETNAVDGAELRLAA